MSRVGQQRAPHWASTPLVEDELPPSCAPCAGGGIVKVATAEMRWDFEVPTSVEWLKPAPEAAADANRLVLHRGGCHCGLVRFECDAPAHVVAWDCNCSYCRMCRNIHFVVPEKGLRILFRESKDQVPSGTDALAEYRFNTGTARHLFCSRCGISPFYRPRSNPDGWAVTLQCVDPGTISSVEVRRFDGQNWDAFYAGQGAAIKKFSKELATEAAAKGVGLTYPLNASGSAAAQADNGSGGVDEKKVMAASNWMTSLAERQYLVLPATLASGVALQTVSGMGGMGVFVVWIVFLVGLMLSCVEAEAPQLPPAIPRANLGDGIICGGCIRCGG